MIVKFEPVYSSDAERMIVHSGELSYQAFITLSDCYDIIYIPDREAKGWFAKKPVKSLNPHKVEAKRREAYAEVLRALLRAQEARPMESSPQTISEAQKGSYGP